MQTSLPFRKGGMITGMKGYRQDGLDYFAAGELDLR